MVMLHKTPATSQEIPCHSPQHKNQIILPNQFINSTSTLNRLTDFRYIWKTSGLQFLL